MPRRTGRPLSLTPALQKKFMKALKATLYVETACDLAEIPRMTVYVWMNGAARHPTDDPGRPDPRAAFPVRG